MDAMFFNSNFSIPELNTSNQDIWLDSIQTALKAMKISHVLKEDSSAKIEEEDDAKALMLIKSSVNDTGKRYILGVPSAKEAINKLNNFYGKDQIMDQLESEFNRLKWDCGQSAELFINSLNDIKSKMQAIDKNISDDPFLRKLLKCAPTSMNHLIAKYEKDLERGKNVTLQEIYTVMINFSNVPVKKQVLEIEQKDSIKLESNGSLHIRTEYLTLTNPSEQNVCFKIRTTDPQRFSARPNNGIIKPKNSTKIALIVQEMRSEDEKLRNEFAKMDKFMVQTTFVRDDQVNEESLWKEIDPSAIMETKIECECDQDCFQNPCKIQ